MSKLRDDVLAILAKYDEDSPEDFWRVMRDLRAAAGVREDDSDQDYQIAVEQAHEALNAITCPFYRGAGSCASGCYTEPSCQTDRPSEGWETQLVDAARTIRRITHAGAR